MRTASRRVAIRRAGSRSSISTSSCSRRRWLPLPEILVDFEQHPAVVVNWALFGSSGHKTRPHGARDRELPVARRDDGEGNRAVKSIVDPRRTVRSVGVNPHSSTTRTASPSTSRAARWTASRSA